MRYRCHCDGCRSSHDSKVGGHPDARVSGTVTIDDWSFKRAERLQDPKKEPYSTGMTIDLTTRTVQLFGSQYPFKITDMNAATIVFSDSKKQTAILGSIDRGTGDLEATITHWLDEQRRDISNEQFYEMKCTPTHRMF
jgi:hypothetical protein